MTAGRTGPRAGKDTTAKRKFSAFARNIWVQQTFSLNLKDMKQKSNDNII
jgi:hypothetical protein